MGGGFAGERHGERDVLGFPSDDYRAAERGYDPVEHRAGELSEDNLV
jgi:hypothetical protein